MANVQNTKRILQPVETSALDAKVSPSTGVISVYGLGGKYPTSLYPNQWEMLLANADKILAFVRSHEAESKAISDSRRTVQRAPVEGRTRL